MASLSSKRKTSVNRRLQGANGRAKPSRHLAAATPIAAQAFALPFDEQLYSQLKSRFESVVSSQCDDGDDLKRVMRVLVQQEFDEGGRDGALRLQPYIVKYVGDYREQLRKAAD